MNDFFVEDGERKLTTKEITAYKISKACPVCGFNKTEEHDFESESSPMYCGGSCRDCKSRWTIYYDVSSIIVTDNRKEASKNIDKQIKNLEQQIQEKKDQKKKLITK